MSNEFRIKMKIIIVNLSHSYSNSMRGSEKNFHRGGVVYEGY